MKVWLFVSSSVTMNVTLQELSSSGSLHKICGKLGLNLSVVSALLAVVNQTTMLLTLLTSN